MRVFSENAAVAGREHDGQSGISFADDVPQFDTVHPRHDDIREDQVEGELVFGQRREGLVGRPHPFGRVTEILQELGGEPADIQVVLNNQDPVS